MNRPLIDYIRAESQCNYIDIIDYYSDINNLGSDELKAKALADLVWFIAISENLDDKAFEEEFAKQGVMLWND